MAINLKFDLTGNPEPPSIVLANRNGNKLGQLNVNVESIDVSDKFNAASEFSFTLNKYIDGEPTPLWDKVVDFKLVYCPEWDMWFEIKVELDEATETVKTVFCTQLGQAELSQIKVYNIHINEEGDPNWDTNNETYKSTFLYDTQNTEASLLHRLLKDKAPHYSIAYVDESIQRIQKTFSFDDTSICDAFNEIAEEIGCLFVYNSNSTKGGKPSRTISVYDLQQKCNDCGHRGEFTDKCPECGSTDIKYGYGKDTLIFVTANELATEGIQLVTDVDSVKNCFKLEGGDDLMTATIRNCNPNGTDYIWYFSDSIKEDMSKELVDGIEGYDKLYKEHYNNHISELNETLVNQYNALVGKYDDYYNTKSTCLDCDTEGDFEEQCTNPNCNSKNILIGQKLQTIPTTITGYPALMTAYYNTIDLLLYLESGLMPKPDIEANKTSAKEQVALLTTSSLSPVAVNVKEAKDISDTTSKSAVLSMAKVLIKSTYKVEAETLAFNNVTNADGEVVAKTWEGKFTVTNYSDDADTATSDNISVTVNNDTKTFIEQKIEKALNKENTDDYSIIGLFAKNLNVDANGNHILDEDGVCQGAETLDENGEPLCPFCAEIKKYALNPLDNFSKTCDTVVSILTEQGVGDDGSNEDDEVDKATKKALYDALYKPYFDKQQAINKEIAIRKNEIAIIAGVWDKSDENNPVCTTKGLQQYIEDCQKEIQEELNFENHLGEDLWLEFCAYRREDKYSNSNYISDGLNNAELFKKANEFIEVAEEEIFKSAELQHSISATLNNLLSLPKFKPLLESFKTGNWIRVQVDGKVYKLRLLEYGFGYGSPESISVEFSDVTKIKNGVTDVKEVLEQASSMASSYDSVQRQAEKGNVARSTIDQWIVDGLNSADVQITSNDSEEILLTKSGLLARSYDDITGTYSPEQFKLTHNIMAYTTDNWETVSSALGKHKYQKWEDNQWVTDTDYGLSSKFVTAGYVTGSQIIGGEIVSSNYQLKNESEGIEAEGTYIDLINGNFSFAGGKIVYNPTTNKVDLSNVTIQWDSANPPTIAEAGLEDAMNEIDALNIAVNPTQIAGGYVASPLIKGGYLDIKNDTNNTGVVIDPNSLVNEEYIFRVYNGNTTAIGLDVDGNAEFSGTINGSHFVGGDLLIGDQTKVGDYAEIANDGKLTCTNVDILGGTLKIGRYEAKYEDGTPQLDENGNQLYSWNTWIDENGVLKATEANIDGTVRASSGSIGGFHIQPDMTDENGTVTQRCGWLYSGELQEGQESVQIGGNKSIFLSATDMSGTMPFPQLIASTDKNGNIVFDENGDVIYNTTTPNLFKEDWRLTIGENFGITSDGTAYMSNCEIVGGSLKMGTASDGYHTWIYSDGVLNASGANINGKITAIEGRIAGWDIDANGIDKKDDYDSPIVGVYSGDVSCPSLVNKNTTSPVRFYAGAWDETLGKTITKTLTFNSDVLSQTIAIDEGCSVLDVSYSPTNMVHSGSGEKSISIEVNQISATATETLEGTITIDVCPSWIPESNIKYTFKKTDGGAANLSYSYNNGKIEILASRYMIDGATTISGTLTYNYSYEFDNSVVSDFVFNEASYISTEITDTEIVVGFQSQATNIEYNIDIKYFVNVKEQNFIVLEDGSLYANATKIRGTVYATDGVFNGTVYATDGSFTGEVIADKGKMGMLTIQEDSISSGADGLTFLPSGIVVAQGLEIRDYFKAANLKIGKISGRSQNSAYFNFESGSTTYHEIIPTATYNITDYGSTGFMGIGYKPGSMTITVTTNYKLQSAQTFEVALRYWNGSAGTLTKKVNVTVLEGEDCGSTTTAYIAKGAVGASLPFSSIGGVSPTKYTEDVPVETSSIQTGGDLIPVNKTYNLGGTTIPWGNIFVDTAYYLGGSAIHTSDVNKKNTVETINEKYTELFDNLRPVTFKFNDGESGRTHIGLIAQELKDSMDICGIDSKDLAAYCSWQDVDENETYGIRYEEFISLCIYEIQKLKKRVKELENK